MRGQDKGQLKLWRSGNPNAQEHMNMVIADFIHSNCLPFSFTEDPKFFKLIHTARQLGSFQPPTWQAIAGKYIDALHEINWKEQMKTIISEGNTFGITVYGDGETIKGIPLINVLATGVNNPLALLDIADCTDHLTKGGMKNASYIAKIIEPMIANLEGELDGNKHKCTRIVDLVFFDGASNVQNAGELLWVKYPCITVGHGAEHVVLLFFKDVYKKVSFVLRIDVYVELALSSNTCLYLYLGPRVSGFVRICKEKPRHLGLSEAQALCYVQEVLSRAQ
jgi:hypothetical protein